MSEPGIEDGDLTRMAILGLIGQRGAVSRAVVARDLDLSPATVSQVTKRFIAEGLLEPLGFEPSVGGRPAQLLGLVATAGHALGLKVAADHMAIADVRLDGQVASFTTLPFDATSAGAPARLAEILKPLAVSGDPPLLGIGIGVPGIVKRPDVGIVDAAVLGWVNVPLGRQLRAALGTTVLVENDVKALAIAERLYGGGRSRRNFVVITIGRGIGFANVADGALRRGATGGAGEIAHVLAGPSKLPCGCGRRGCLDAEIGAEGILSAARLAGVLGRNEGMERLTELADSGDATTRGIFARAGQLLARTVAAPIAAIDPDLVLIAGEGSANWRHWDGPFRSTLSRQLPSAMSNLAVEVGSWDDTSWARGAAAIVLATPFDRHALAGPQRPHVLARLQRNPGVFDEDAGVI